MTALVVVASGRIVESIENSMQHQARLQNDALLHGLTQTMFGNLQGFS